jgi:peptidoglycan-associated lipoprotein
MKRKLNCTMMTLALVGLLLSAGCAKKPLADTMPAVDQPDAAAQTDSIGTIQDAALEDAAASEQQAMTDETTLVVALETIHFAFDQHTLTTESREILSQNAVLLQTNPKLNIDIEGHCDERGSDEYNLALGARRAQAARDYMVSLGVAPERVATISYGEEMPLDPSTGEEAWAKNRRAAFKLQN